MSDNNTSLPAEVVADLNEKAELSTDILSNDETNSRDYLKGYKQGWKDGATEWAQWKMKYDELEKKIDRILHDERNAMQVKLSEQCTFFQKEHIELKERAERMVDTFKKLINAPVPATDREYMAWFVAVKNIAGGVISEWEAEKEIAAWKEGKEEEPKEPLIPLAVYKQQGSKTDLTNPTK